MSDKPSKPRPRLVPVSDREQVEKIMNAIVNYADEFSSSAEWSDLDELSTHTELEGLEADSEGIFLVEGKNEFEATANAYVTLNYGSKSDSSSFPDSYPAHVTGHFEDNGEAKIDTFVVDTSSFYE